MRANQTQIENFYRQFCTETFDDTGRLTDFSVRYPDNFNFAYDVVDAMADLDPDRIAMEWCNKAGAKKTITFGQMKAESNRFANVFLSHGIGKGDFVMLILKRHYEYWYATLALHKIGAILIPATNMLTVKDIVYRIEKAGIKAIVCTNEGSVADFVAEAAEKTHLPLRFIVRESRPGFIPLTKEAEAASASLHDGLLHVGYDRRTQGGLPRLHLSAGPHHHRQALAEGAG